MYTVEELANYISFEEIPKSWFSCYENVKNSYKLNWLDSYDFKKILSFYELDDSFKERFLEEINVLKKDNKLNQVCFILYYILYFADKEDFYDIWFWEINSTLFKNKGSFMIPVVALLCGFDFHVMNMKRRNFSKEQINYQKYNVRITCTNDRLNHGIDGIRFSQMIWGSFFIRGSIIQVGRLQYEVGVGNFNRLKRYFNGEDHTYVYIHIPKGDKLDDNDVSESLSKARECVRKYYPEYDNVVYFTETWLLSPEVKEILPANSNIIKFQNRFEIVSYGEDTKNFLTFVFNEVLNSHEYKDLAEKTMLQRGLKKMLLDGKELHSGLGILKR